MICSTPNIKDVSVCSPPDAKPTVILHRGMLDGAAGVAHIETFHQHTKARESDTSSRQCYSKRLTEKLKTPYAKTEQAITSLSRTGRL